MSLSTIVGLPTETSGLVFTDPSLPIYTHYLNTPFQAASNYYKLPHRHCFRAPIDIHYNLEKRYRRCGKREKAIFESRTTLEAEKAEEELLCEYLCSLVLAI